jgi:cytidine deaminase
VQEVSFDPRYLDWVRTGRKTRTTRFGEAVALGPARLRFESTPPVLLDAFVTGIRTVGLADLDDVDAAAENFADAGALRDALRYHYPGLSNDAVVSVVSFGLGRQQG